MRKPTWGIGATFQRLDDSVGAADRFADVRTFRKRYENQNALLSKSLRRCVFTQSYNSPLTIKGHRFTTWKDLAAAFETTILVNQFCQSLQVKIRCCKTDIAGGTSGDPSLYWVVHRLGERLSPDLHGVEMSITTAYTTTESSLANYTDDIPLPMISSADGLRNGRQAFVLGLYCYPAIVTDADVTTGAAITGVTRDGLVFAGAGSSEIGALVRFSNSALGPRRIVGYGATSGVYHVDPPIDEIPVEGTDTATTNEVVGVNLYGMSVYENPVTDFTASHGSV